MARSVLTLPEAAQFLGVAPEELSLLRESGALPARQRSGEWVFDRSDLEKVADGYLRPDPVRPAPYEAERLGDRDDAPRNEEDSDHALLGGALEATPIDITPPAHDSGMLWQALDLDEQEVSSLAQPILEGVPAPPEAPRNGQAARDLEGVLEGKPIPEGNASPHVESPFSSLSDLQFESLTDPGDFGEPDSADLAPASEEELSREDSLILDGVPLLGDGAFPAPPPINGGLGPFDEPGDLDAMLEGPEENRWPGPPSSVSTPSSTNVFEDGPRSTAGPTPAAEMPSLSFDGHEPSNVNLDKLLGGNGVFGSAASGSISARGRNEKSDPDIGGPGSSGPEDFPSLSFDGLEPSRARLETPFGPTEFAPAPEGSSLPPPTPARPSHEEPSRNMMWADDDDGELDRILGDAGEEFGSSASTQTSHDPFADLLSGDEPGAEPPSADEMPLAAAPTGPSGSGAFSHLDQPDAEEFSGLDLDTPLWSEGPDASAAHAAASYASFDGPDDPPGALPDADANYPIDPHAELHATDVEFSEIDLDAPGATVVVPGNTRMIEELREHAARARRDEREVSGEFSSINNFPAEISLPDDEDDTVQIETFDPEPSQGDDRQVSLADLRSREDHRPVYDPASTDSPWIDPDPSDTSIQGGNNSVESPFEDFGTAPSIPGPAWTEPTHVELVNATDETSHVFDGEFGRRRADDDPPTVESQLAAEARQTGAEAAGDGFDGPRSPDEPSLPPWLLPPRPPSDSDAIARPIDDEDDAEVLGVPEPGAPQAPTLIGMGSDFDAIHPGAVRMTTDEERLSDSQLVSNAPTMIGRTSGDFDALHDAVNVNTGYSDSSLASGAPSLISPSSVMTAKEAYDSVDLNSAGGGMALDEAGSEEMSHFGAFGGPSPPAASSASHQFQPPSGEEELDDASSSVFDDGPRERSALAESLSDEFVVGPNYSPNTVYFDPFRESPSVEFLNDIDLSALTTDVVELPSPSRLAQRTGLSGVFEKPTIENPADAAASGAPASAGSGDSTSEDSLPPAAALPSEDESSSLAATAAAAAKSATDDLESSPVPSADSSIWSSTEADLSLSEALQSSPEVGEAAAAIPAAGASSEPIATVPETPDSLEDDPFATPAPSSPASESVPPASEPPAPAPAVVPPLTLAPLPAPKPTRRAPSITPSVASAASLSEASSMMAGPALTTGFARSPLTSSRIAASDAPAVEAATAAPVEPAPAVAADEGPAYVKPAPIERRTPVGPRRASDSPALVSPAPVADETPVSKFDLLLLGVTVAVMVVVGFFLGMLFTGLKPNALRGLLPGDAKAAATATSGTRRDAEAISRTPAETPAPAELDAPPAPEATPAPESAAAATGAPAESPADGLALPPAPESGT